jgi:predicted MFS family arabinose efflux permease
MVFTIASPALVPALVPASALAAANARLELARSTAFAAGPALAGAAVAWTGAAPAFALAAALSLLAALLLAGLAEPPRAATPRRHIAADLAEGFTFVRHHALLRPILLTMVVWNTAWFVLQAVFVPFAIHRVGLDAAWVGISLGAYGVGMVAGALGAPILARHVRFGTLIALGPAGSVLASAVVAGAIVIPGPTMPVLGFFLFGAFPILWTITQTTLRQAVTPAALIGRVSALNTMAGWGARPVGAALGGFVGAEFGVVAAVLLATAIFGMQALVIFASPVPRLERLPA